MDTQTRHALKQDKFVQATKGSVGWVETHRSTALRYSVIGVVILGLLIAGIVLYVQKSEAAEGALGAALDIYSAPLAQPGAPAEKGSYTTTAARAKAANDGFLHVIRSYGWLPQASKARYFAGLTYEDLGQNGSAESELKAAAASWDGNLSSLAKFALAGFYHQTGRDGQAIDLYNGLAAKPTNAVPAYTAQLALADLYVAAGKQDQAKQIWAKIKDQDKTGPAGSVATQKLTGKS